jgi:dipeptidyl-peptidase III
MKDGKIVDIKLEFPDDFTEQMLEYGKEHSFLPVNN